MYVGRLRTPINSYNTGTHLPLGSCHSAQQLVTLAFIYMLIYLR